MRNWVRNLLRSAFLSALVLPALSAGELPTLPERPVITDHYRYFNQHFSPKVFDEVLADIPAHGKDPSLPEVEAWLAHAHHKFRYRDPGDAQGKSYEELRRPGGPSVPRHPRQVEDSKSGDCKEKALWLFAKIQDPKAALVYGMTRLSDKRGHAWLYYFANGKWWILDPTNHEVALPATGRTKTYHPVYSFTTSGVYKHTSEHAFKAWKNLSN